eukprot:3733711-Pyramimonas_sp.AAC.1
MESQETSKTRRDTRYDWDALLTACGWTAENQKTETGARSPSLSHGVGGIGGMRGRDPRSGRMEE